MRERFASGWVSGNDRLREMTCVDFNSFSAACAMSRRAEIGVVLGLIYAQYQDLMVC
jgi:hypothetical protein